MINVQENILLKDFTTFHIGGPARYFVTVKDTAELKEAVNFAKDKSVKFMILGGGSNLLIADAGYSGVIIKNEIKKKEILDNNLVTFGSGENWDEVVAFSVAEKLSGLENLSGIPGTVGATPVQNVGAYGVEVKDTIVEVRTLNAETGEEKNFTNAECQFTYRDSIFKKPEYKKYIITEVVFQLKTNTTPNINYKDLKKYFTEASDVPVTLSNVRSAVLKIREGKFPDWHKVGLAGSFFKNPIVTAEKHQELISIYKDLVSFPATDGRVKISLAWILDHVCNLKGYKVGNVGLYEKQPLALVNFGGASAEEINNFAEEIKKIVKEKTGLEIEEEAERVIHI